MGLASPKVMLPVLKHGGTYAFNSTIYNLSVVANGKTYYVALGVLKVTGEPTGNLEDYRTDKKELISVANCNFAYSNVADPLNTGISLSAITSGDVLHFLCLHDNNFDINNGGLSKLNTIKSKVSTYIAASNYKAMTDPTDGNGGTLDVTGCHF